MTYIHDWTIDGHYFPRVAWTGGDKPLPDVELAQIIRYHHAADQSHLVADWRAYVFIRGALYREALADWFGMWADMPNTDTRMIMWNRARFTAWRTVTEA